MKKLFAAIVASAFCTYAAAAPCTWSLQGTKAVCATGTEDAPTLVTQGLALGTTGAGWRAVKSITVHAETAGTMTAGGKLKAYLWNPIGGDGTGQWNPCPDLDLTVAALADQSFPDVEILGPIDRIAFVPSGVGVAVTIFLRVTH